jgi:hypothetical protein
MPDLWLIQDEKMRITFLELEVDGNRHTEAVVKEILRLRVWACS